MSTEAKRARLERAFTQRAIPEAAALLSVLDELAARTGLIWRYDTELGIRASCTVATPTITTDGAGPAGDAWTDDGELDPSMPGGTDCNVRRRDRDGTASGDVADHS